MDIGSLIALIISGFSLIVSGLVGYFSHLKPAKPKILLGSTIKIFNSFTNLPREGER